MKKLENMKYELNEKNISFEEFDKTFFECSIKWTCDAEIKKLIFAQEVELRERVLWFEGLKNRDDYFIRGVSLDSRPIGVVGIKHINYKEKSGEYWGYIGEKDEWGHGIGQVMVKEMIRIAKLLDIKKFYLYVGNENIRAQLLYKKMGFLKIGMDNECILMEMDI